LFQDLLRALAAIAHRHATDIATVASAAVLARPGVSAVIVGARNATHLASNLRIASLELSADDHAAIEAVLAKSTPIGGEVYALERDTTGRHGSIMKYNLNSEEKTTAPSRTA
jgi:diketogulonate reductase-like aldo/keto reductase